MGFYENATKNYRTLQYNLTCTYFVPLFLFKDVQLFHTWPLMLLFMISSTSTEDFIRNFSAPYSLLQRHLVGEEDRKPGKEEDRQVNAHQQLVAHPIITELTTSTFLPYVMDIQKVRTNVGCVSV